MNEERSAYKTFVEGAGGKDFLQWIIALEASIQIQAYQSKTVEEKALALERMRGLYDARSHLIEMSTAPKTVQLPSKKANGG